MQLGYSITSFHPSDVSPSEAVDRVLERARVARECGYDYVEAGDHHVVGGGNYLQNVPISARLAEVFDHVATMFLLPLYHPVSVAEQAGTLAALTDEFDLWCAVGGNPDAFSAFGVPLEERAPRMEEAIALIRALWSGDEVDFDGEFFSVDGISVNPKAGGRICIGGSAKPAVQRAGRMGDAWVPGPAETLSDIERKKRWFEDAGGGRLLVRREALVLEDGDRAREIAREKLERGYRGWPADSEWVLSGDPDDVTADLERLQKLGADEVVVRPMSDTYAIETLRAVARGRDRL